MRERIAASPDVAVPSMDTGAMTRDELAVQVVVSDPWEFTTETGENVFAASVHRVSSEKGAPRFPLVVRLEESVRAGSVEGTEVFVVTSHEVSRTAVCLRASRSSAG